MLPKLLLFFLLFQGPVPVNPVGVATNCQTKGVDCVYVDTNVTPGSHTYFVEAQLNNINSIPSNSVTVTVPTGTHNVTLSWDPSTAPGVTYFIFRTSPPTLTIQQEN